MSKITKEVLSNILENRHKNSLYKSLKDLPHPNSFKDMQKAIKRIEKAILNKEKIMLVGDYDVDGVVSTSIMIEFFKAISYPIEYIIPNRFTHGYGLSTKIVSLLDHVSLVITVDNGISSIKTADILKKKNIDLIITDHHTVPDILPQAYAIINPKQKDCTFNFKDICGAQVAWYLCAAIKNHMNFNINMSIFLDLLSLAIIADMMPMHSLNFIMVKKGLEKIKESKRAAFICINDIMKKEKFSSDDIGFFIAPKINCAGRMDDAKIALEFLLSSNINIANEKFDLLNQLNIKRKKIQEDITLSAKKEVNEEDSVIVVWGKDWHEGVIGIVASTLCNSYKKPSFVFSINNGIAKGSARSNASLDLHKMISYTKNLLLGFGGHKNAAGLSLEEKNLSLFKKEINEIVKKQNVNLHNFVKPIGEVEISNVDIHFIDIIESFEPYGIENSKPIFEIKDAKVLDENLIGQEKNHLKMTLQVDNTIFEGLKFYTNEKLFKDSVNLIVSISKNEFRGITKPQFLIQDFF